MIERDKSLPENSVSNNNVTLEKAKAYERKRFTEYRRMRKLDKFEKKFAVRLFEMVGKDSAILDIPCGNGRFYEVFSGVRELVLADYSENMLTATEERIGSVGNVRLIQADISSIPLSDNSMDLCFCMRLFHHMKNEDIRVAALKDLARVSRKYVAFSFYDKKCLRYFWRKCLGKKIRGNYTTIEDFVKLAKPFGLKLVSSFRCDFIEQQTLVLFEKL